MRSTVTGLAPATGGGDLRLHLRVQRRGDTGPSAAAARAEPQAAHGRTARTVTDFGASVTESRSPSSVAVIGFGDTVFGASNVLTLSIAGPVSVSPVAVLAVMPVSRVSNSTGRFGSMLVRASQSVPDCVSRRHGVDARQRDGAVRVGARVEGHRHERRVLERHVHPEHVVGRRQDHLLLVGEDHRLQDVHHLRDVGHAHAVGMAREDVDVERGDQRVAHAVLLGEEARRAARQRRVPRAPLVDDERDLLLGVVLVHDRRVGRDEAVHLDCGLEDPGVVGFVEADRR